MVSDSSKIEHSIEDRHLAKWYRETMRQYGAIRKMEREFQNRQRTLEMIARLKPIYSTKPKRRRQKLISLKCSVAFFLNLAIAVVVFYFIGIIKSK